MSDDNKQTKYTTLQCDLSIFLNKQLCPIDDLKNVEKLINMIHDSYLYNMKQFTYEKFQKHEVEVEKIIHKWFVEILNPYTFLGQKCKIAKMNIELISAVTLLFIFKTYPIITQDEEEDLNDYGLLDNLFENYLTTQLVSFNERVKTIYAKWTKEGLNRLLYLELYTDKSGSV